MENEQNLIRIYEDKRVTGYLHREVDKVCSVITNVEKLERSIYKQLVEYYDYVVSRDKRLSYGRIYELIDREIAKAKKEHRLQEYHMYSDLAVTDDYGESLEYVPTDDQTDVLYDVIRCEEREKAKHWAKKKTARLSASGFESVVLKAWSYGIQDVRIAEELALHNYGKVKSLAVKISRFKEQCRKELNDIIA